MDPDRSCPLGHTCKDCHWYILIQGKDPNTGQDINRKDCAIAWIPTLLIDNSMRQHQTGAAIDQLRDIVSNDNDQLKRIMIAAARPTLAAGEKEELLSHEPG